MIVPVSIGLGTGILFMFLLFIIIAKPFSPPAFDKSTLAVIADDKRGMVNEMIENSRELEEVQLFLMKYPFARMDLLYFSEIELYGGEAGEFVIGHKHLLDIWYSGPVDSTFILTENRHGTNVPQIVLIQPFLMTAMDSNGMLHDMELRCNITYHDRPGNTDSLIKGNEEIRQRLQVAASPCDF